MSDHELRVLYPIESAPEPTRVAARSAQEEERIKVVRVTSQSGSSLFVTVEAPTRDEAVGSEGKKVAFNERHRYSFSDGSIDALHSPAVEPVTRRIDGKDVVTAWRCEYKIARLYT